MSRYYLIRKVVPNVEVRGMRGQGVEEKLSKRAGWPDGRARIRMGEGGELIMHTVFGNSIVGLLSVRARPLASCTFLPVRRARAYVTCGAGRGGGEAAPRPHFSKTAQTQMHRSLGSETEFFIAYLRSNTC